MTDSKVQTIPSGPDADKLKRYAGRITKAKQEMDDCRMAHAEIYGEAKEDGFHNGALKLALKLKNQEATKTADFLRAFEQYCHILGVNAQMDMLDEAAA